MADSPGNGSSSPFGNGAGNVSTGSGMNRPGVNFVLDPSGGYRPPGGGVDFSAQTRTQPKDQERVDPGSVPTAGRLLARDPKVEAKDRLSVTLPGTDQPRHFKLDGEMPAEMPAAQGPSESPAPAAPAAPTMDLMAGEIPPEMG